jgi:hypothetical protein
MFLHKFIETHLFYILDTISDVKIKLTPEQVEILEKGRVVFFEFMYNLPTYIVWFLYWVLLIYIYCNFIVKEPCKWEYIRARGSLVGPQRIAGNWVRTYFELYERVIMCFGLLDDLYEEEQFFLTYWLPFNESTIHYKDLFFNKKVVGFSRTWNQFYIYDYQNNFIVSNFNFLYKFYNNKFIIPHLVILVKTNNISLLSEHEYIIKYSWLECGYLNNFIYLTRNQCMNILMFNTKFSHLEKDKLDMMKFLVLYKLFMVNFEQLVFEELKNKFINNFTLFPDPILPIKERDAFSKKMFLFRQREYFVTYFFNKSIVNEKTFLSFHMLYWSSDYFLTMKNMSEKVYWNSMHKNYGSILDYLTYDLDTNVFIKKSSFSNYSSNLYCYVNLKKIKVCYNNKLWIKRHMPRQDIEIIEKIDDIESSFIIRKWHPYLKKCQTFEELYLW